VRVKATAISPQWKAIFQGQEVDLGPVLDLIKAQIREVALQNEIPIPEKDLLDIMYNFQYSQATNPWDKIYAMLDLAQSKRVQVKVEVSYSETIKDAYKKLEKALEELYGDVGIWSPNLITVLIPILSAWVTTILSVYKAHNHLQDAIALLDIRSQAEPHTINTQGWKLSSLYNY